MTELVVNLPSKPPGHEVEVFPYGMQFNKTKVQIPDQLDDDGKKVAKLICGADFTGKGFVPPPVEAPEPDTSDNPTDTIEGDN